MKAKTLVTPPLRRLVLFILSLAVSACATAPRSEIDTPCSLDRAYYGGLAGWDYARVCPDGQRDGQRDDKRDIRETFERGQKARASEIALHAAQTKRSEKIKEQNDDHSVVGDISKAFLLIGTGSTTPSEDRDIAAAEKDASDARQGVQLTSGFQTPIEDFSTNFGGAALGTVFGFGLGHAIHGTFQETGWKFAASETAALTGAVIATNQCLDQPQNRQASSFCSWAPSTFIISFLGLRVWESISVWSEFSEHQKLRFTPLVSSPEGPSPGLTVSLETF